MSWSCISWDSDHYRTHTLRRRAAERKLQHGVASCNFFLVFGWTMDGEEWLHCWQKSFYIDLWVYTHLLGLGRGITGYILFGVAQRRKFSSMVKLVFIFIWVLDGLNIYVHGWRGSVLVPVFLLVFVKLLAMKQYRCGPQEHCFSFGYHIIDSLCFHWEDFAFMAWMGVKWSYVYVLYMHVKGALRQMK